MIASLILAASVLAPVSPGAGAGRPLVSLVASPSHVTLAGRARRTIHVTNSGVRAVVVDVARAGFALDLRGRPRVVARGPGGRRVTTSWLTVRPLRLALAPGRSASLTVASELPRRLEPGDHDALVLLTTRRRGSGVSVRMRLGIVVVVRVPGVIVRRLELLALRVRRPGHARRLELFVANRGNITEALDRRCVSVSLRRRGRELARLWPTARDLLPRTRGIVEIRYRGRLRGRLTVRVEHSGRAPCGRGLSRTFRIRL